MIVDAEANLDGLHHVQLKDRVYAFLRQGIIAGEFETGLSLREVDVANRLGVSKTPVREAFVRLQKDRFVRQIPYRGVVVAGYSRTDLRELYELRELLEGACIRDAAANAEPAFIAAITRNIKATQQAGARKDTDAMIALFDDFDDLLYKQTDNRWIRDLIENLDGHLKRIGRLTVDLPGRLQTSLGEHVAIYDAVIRRDPVMAEQLMRNHIASVMADQLADFKGSEV